MKKALIQLHIAVFLAGFTAILGKLILLNEGLLVWYRLFITVVTLWIILFYQKKLELVSAKDALRFLGVGTIVALHWVTFYGSVKYANISVALVCFSASGFFTAILEPLILKRKVVFTELALGLMVIAGIYIIFDFHPQYKTGIAFGIVSATGSALFPVFNKPLTQKFAPQTITLYELGGGLIALTVLVPLYLIKFPASYYFPDARDWLWLIVLAWLCTVLSFNLQLNALKKVSAFTVNLTYNLEPVYGIIMAFFIFNEKQYLDASFFAGLFLITLALLLQMYLIKAKK